MNTEPQNPGAPNERPPIEKKPRKASSDEIEARRLRVLQYRYRSGLSTTDIAKIERVDQSQISRDLKWWKQRWKRERKDGGAYVDELLARFDEIYDAAAQQRALLSGDAKQGIKEGSTFEKTRCMMVMLAATMAKAKVLVEAGRIAPDKDDDGKATSYSPSEIRRLAEHVRTANALPAGAGDMIPRGEREFLEGEIADADEDSDDDV